ncbi:Sulfate adenylyltransferase [Smittium culicis]|uniref:sulfate adenylyltransferase n=1 Tax=Smittium culicis TaxID=133412 RepID=A0A1R1XX85_9FUNG|nr:Sulfate adenylyltransferase [Smittium culicis]OMJ26219.1 Sulfate adenylyltransferase [Smittium culicis]
MTASDIISPYGNKLNDLLARDAGIKAQLEAEAKSLPRILLNERQLCDLELIMNGGFSPLTGFFTKEMYDGVVENMRLPDNTLWPIPIYLDIYTEKFNSENSKEHQFDSLKPQSRVVLVDPRNNSDLAILTISDIYKIDFINEAKKVYNTTDDLHPAVKYLYTKTGEVNLGGEIQAINPISHSDFIELRLTPSQTRKHFRENMPGNVVAFQTRNPMHRAHLELTVRAGKKVNANIFVHPVVGMTKPGDIDYVTRVKVYKMIMEHYNPRESAFLSLLPLAMRMGGPKEAVLHAIIRRNYGATHIIVGRDHAGPGSDKQGNLFYGPYDAQELAIKYKSELGIEIVPFSMLTYLPDQDIYEEFDKLEPGTKTLNISGTELRNRLVTGQEIPEWFSFANVVKVLREGQEASKSS